jgi:hypothetical protein
MTSDIDDEDVLISRAELKGLTQAQAGAVQMLNLLVRRCKFDKDKDESIREVGNNNREELVEEITTQWGIKEGVEVKSMKMAPWSTQVAVVVLPANGVPRKDNRLRTELTIASFRILTNVQR